MAVFELGGALSPALSEMTVGPWTPARRKIAAFDAGPGQPEALWRVDLDRDVAASRAALTLGERSVDRAHATLDDIPRRLERALAEVLARDSGTRPGPPRGSRDELPALSPIESALVDALTRAEAPLPARPSPPSGRREDGSPGLPGGLSSFATDSPGPLARALQGAVDLARGRARIETHVDGVLVARSVTTLSGDTELVIAPGLSPAGARLHARSVAIAVRTRHAWARILALAVTCCSRLIRLGMPPAGVLALPLVWGFIRDLLYEARRLGAAIGRDATAGAPSR